MFRYLFIFIIIFLSCFSHSSEKHVFVPDEFEELTQDQELDYEIELPNHLFIKVKGVGNYFNISKISDKEQFISSLQSSGLKYESALNLFEIINKSVCKEKICKDELISSYNYDKKTFVLNVPSEMMDVINSNNIYNKLEPEGDVFILKNNYSSYFDTNGANLNLDSEGTIGIGKSNINFYQQISEDEYTLNSISYNNQFADGYALSLYYSSFLSVLDNGASRLDYSSPLDRKTLQLKTSDNQLKSSKEVLKKLYFDMKSDGLVKVIIDNKVIKTNFYKKGQNYISYNKLPKGNYTLTLELNPDGYEQEKITQVINNISSNISYRGYDYSLSINNAKFSSDDSDSDSDSFVEFLGVKQGSDDFSYGGSLRATENDLMVGGYLNYILPDFNVSTYYDYSSKGGYLAFDLSYLGFSLDISKKKTKENNEHELVDLLYGADDFEQKSISYSYNSYIGGLRVSYLSYLVSSPISGEREDTSLNFYFNKMLFRDISLDLSYSVYDSKSNDGAGYKDNILTVALSMPLGNNVQVTSSLNSSKKYDSRVENYIQYDDFISNSYDVNNSLSLSNSVSDSEVESSLSFNAYVFNDKLDANTYLRIDDSGDVSANLNVDSTLIIANNNLYVTSQDDDSFVIIDNTISNKNKAKDNEFNDFGQVNLTKNSDSIQQASIHSDYTVIGLDSYETYKYNIDTGISNYENKSKSNNGSLFSYPGTAKVIDNKLRKAVTFLTYFEDFNNNSVNNIECKGRGCSSVSKVGDGIYSITIFEDEKYKLVSNNEYCLTSNVDIKFNGGVSRCFPSITEDEDGYQIVSEGFGTEDESIYFLGQVSTLLDESKLNIYRESGIEIIKYEFGKEKYFLFAKLEKDKKHSSYAMLKSVVNELDSYVSNVDLDSLYSNVIIVDE
ncbi:TPA: CS1-pili formation C-terminal domain-containing protein [Photobacterium damselae]